MKLPFDLIILDLEMNQPSQKIIEIGAVKFLRNGDISEKVFQRYVQIDEAVHEEVSVLTGITNKVLEEKGVALFEAINVLASWAISETKNVCFSGWGGDFHWLLQECLQLNISWPLRYKNYDIKSFVFWSAVNKNLKFSSDGLGTMMKLFNAGWDDKFGPQHRAVADAWNTARLLQTVALERHCDLDAIYYAYKSLGGIR